MIERVVPSEKLIKEIRTPKQIINKMLLGGWNKHVFSAQEVQEMVYASNLTRMEGQTLYYPGKIEDLPNYVKRKGPEVIRLVMENHAKIQKAVSDVLVELGCDLFCVIDPTLEREDLLGTGYSTVHGKSHLLLKEGKPGNPMPYADRKFDRTDFSAYERVVRYIGIDMKTKFFKLVENLAGSPYLMETNNYSFLQNMQVLVDTMKKCNQEHLQGNVIRDIKQENCLIVQDPSRKLGVRGKLTDQELMEREGMIPIDPDTKKRKLTGTPDHYDVMYYRYYQNEIDSLSLSIDVFAYGITLLALYLEKDFDKFIDKFHRTEKGEKGEKPKYSPYLVSIDRSDISMVLAGLKVDIPNDVLELIISMLQKDRNSRPKLHVVIKFLKDKYDLE